MHQHDQPIPRRDVAHVFDAAVRPKHFVRYIGFHRGRHRRLDGTVDRRRDHEGRKLSPRDRAKPANIKKPKYPAQFMHAVLNNK